MDEDHPTDGGPQDRGDGGEERPGPPPHPRDILGAMSDAEYRRLFRRLVAWTAHRAGKRYRWNTPTGLPEWKTVSDVVGEAVLDVVSASPESAWDPRKGRGTLEGFLRMIAGRKLHKLWERKGHQLQQPETDPSVPPIGERTPNGEPSPEQDMERSEARADWRDLIEEIRRNLADRDGELVVFDGLLAGRKPGEIAGRLGVAPGEVYRRRRNLNAFLESRLGRRARRFFADHPQFSLNGDDPDDPPGDSPDTPSPRPEE